MFFSLVGFSDLGRVRLRDAFSGFPKTIQNPSTGPRAAPPSFDECLGPVGAALGALCATSAHPCAASHPRPVGAHKVTFLGTASSGVSHGVGPEPNSVGARS